MPELPEVETIKKGLNSKIIGKIVTGVLVESEKSFQGDKEEVIGSSIVSVERRAKVIRIHLSNNYNLLIHLKMTGQLIYTEQNTRFAGGHPSDDWNAALPNKHTRITFTFNDDSKLFFNDIRKFGWCRVLTNEQVEKFFSEFGPEPFSKDFTVKYLEERAKRVPTRTLIQFIMDQKIIAGVGNIYANESLFLAGIMPTTRVKFLKDADWEKVIKEIKFVLEQGIRFGGTTDNNYVDVEGKKGEMQFHLNVYRRNAEPCPNGCKGDIEKIKLGSRGVFFCKCCQKELK